MKNQRITELVNQIMDEKNRESVERDLFLRELLIGGARGTLTGLPSQDKPWLKYYDEESLIFEVPNTKIYDAIYNENKNHLDDVAFEYYGANITYREMFDKIELLAKSFKEIGIKENDIVTMGMLTTPDAICTMLALNRIGAISSMIDPRSNVKGLHKYLKDNGSDIVIITDLFYKKFKEAIPGTKTKKVITSSIFDSMKKWPFNNPIIEKQLSRIKEKTKIKSKDNLSIKMKDFIKIGKGYTGKLDSEYKEGEPTLIVHSGGTTGFPKAVVMSNKSVMSAVYQALNTGIQFKRGESWLGILPLFIIYGASTGTILPLLKGIKINLVPLFNPKKLPKILLKKKPIHMTLAPSHFEYLVGNKLLENEDLSYIVAPTVGGDSMNIKLEQETNEWLKSHGCSYKVSKGYGSSETCSGITVCISDECNKLGSVGIPLPHTTVGIFDIETGKELSYNEPGEVCISGPSNMLKYLNSEEETDLVLKEHDGKLWVHSGDYGYIDEEGLLFVTDRIKRMIIDASGFKILPSYVESILNKHKNVESSVVIGMPDNDHVQGEIPIACIVLKDITQSAKTIQELNKLCLLELKDNLSCPREYYLLDEIPYKTTNGKVDIQKLKQIVEEKKQKEKTKTKRRR